MLKRCKYCHQEQPEENFEIANVINGKTYRRSRCRSCKQTQQNQRRKQLYTFIRE